MSFNSKVFLFLIIAIAKSVLSFSQIITIDKADTNGYVKKEAWNGNISLGLEIDKQKATLFDASNFVDVSLQKFHEFFILSASSRFTYNGPQDFLNAGYVHLRWRHNYINKWHPETFTQYQWDNKRGLKKRYLLGENIRYNLWRKRKRELSFATGLMYENEIWDYVAVDTVKIPPNPVDQHSSFLKSTSYVKWDEKISDNSKFTFIVFYQAAFNHFWQPRIAVNLNLNVNISKHFSLETKAGGLYDAKPVVPIFNFYYNLSNSIVYKF
jgi:Protein of unknown function, DUF481